MPDLIVGRRSISNYISHTWYDFRYEDKLRNTSRVALANLRGDVRVHGMSRSEMVACDHASTGDALPVFVATINLLADSIQIFYVAPDIRLISADVTAQGASLTMGAVRAMLQIHPPRTAQGTVSVRRHAERRPVCREHFRRGRLARPARRRGELDERAGQIATRMTLNVRGCEAIPLEEIG